MEMGKKSVAFAAVYVTIFTCMATLFQDLAFASLRAMKIIVSIISSAHWITNQTADSSNSFLLFSFCAYECGPCASFVVVVASIFLVCRLISLSIVFWVEMKSRWKLFPAMNMSLDQFSWCGMLWVTMTLEKELPKTQSVCMCMCLVQH